MKLQCTMFVCHKLAESSHCFAANAHDPATPSRKSLMHVQSTLVNLLATTKEEIAYVLNLWPCKVMGLYPPIMKKLAIYLISELCFLLISWEKYHVNLHVSSEPIQYLLRSGSRWGPEKLLQQSGRKALCDPTCNSGTQNTGLWFLQHLIIKITLHYWSHKFQQQWKASQ